MEVFKIEKNNLKHIKCPFCGYLMPILKRENAVCSGLYVKCKARHCKKEFEIKINK